MMTKPLFLINSLMIPEREFLNRLKTNAPSKWADYYTEMFVLKTKVTIGLDRYEIRTSEVGPHEQLKMEL